MLSEVEDQGFRGQIRRKFNNNQLHIHYLKIAVYFVNILGQTLKLFSVPSLQFIKHYSDTRDY